MTFARFDIQRSMAAWEMSHAAASTAEASVELVRSLMHSMQGCRSVEGFVEEKKDPEKICRKRKWIPSFAR
jgi:hypothetical protein